MVWILRFGRNVKIKKDDRNYGLLNVEKLYTILCDAESVLNSRPLTYLSEDNDDLVALTPSMFLQEIKEVGVPEMDLIDANRMNKRFAYRLRIRQELRRRFRIEYLGQLREFSKIRKEADVQEGDVVLVGDSNTKKTNWPLAKVQKLYPSKDGKVRVVEVKTKSGSFLRPVQRLYPLEVREAERSYLRGKDSHPAMGRGEAEAISLDTPFVPVPMEPVNSGVRKSRFGRLLKPVQR